MKKFFTVFACFMVAANAFYLPCNIFAAIGWNFAASIFWFFGTLGTVSATALSYHIYGIFQNFK